MQSMNSFIDENEAKIKNFLGQVSTSTFTQSIKNDSPPLPDHVYAHAVSSIYRVIKQNKASILESLSNEKKISSERASRIRTSLVEILNEIEEIAEE